MGFIETIGNFLYNILDAVGSILPRDPFLQFFSMPDAVIYKYLSIINWFVPVPFLSLLSRPFLLLMVRIFSLVQFCGG